MRGKPKVLNPSKKKSKTKASKSIKKTTVKKTTKKTTKAKTVKRAGDSKIENADVVHTRPGAKLPRAATEVHSLNKHSTDNVTNATVVETKPAVVVDPAQKIAQYRFEVGTKYMLDTTIFHVKKAYADSNTEFRKLWSLENGEEVVELSSLMRDKFDQSFHLVED